MDDIATYQAKVRELYARAEASITAVEACEYLDLARAWEELAREAPSRVLSEPRTFAR